ncbi:MAG: GHKL domain-containing protein [Sphingobacteriales bacterium]|nr:MAG: GHKL domain-containing protein [Sphingobacteriales bacterium]
MLFDLLIVIIVVRYLKKNLSVEELTPEWNKNLTLLMFVSIGLFVGQAMLKSAGWLIELASHALVWFLAWIIYNKKEWIKVKPILNAMLPLLAIKTISDIVEKVFPDFYGKYSNYFETGAVFGMVWLAAMVIINNKQRRALEKEKLKVEEKEKEIKITEKLKATLEVQVQERTAELMKQKEELQHALDDLKSAQVQLIHSEKMASLGELTAGIAHEIQNPLNFVNNFSEVNKELIEELNAERLKPAAQRNEQLENELLNDIKENEEKINHHGQRAADIVKGMLQHSRSSSGVKEPTDINALCDEYIRLAYHGLRAKDKSFNANFKTSFDKSIDKINIIPQEIGRVILNLLNNAFYAVSEKQKTVTDNYEPTVTISTQKQGNKILVKVSDNGNGIPASIKDKIFQPFFTTKPTGQGTGLGLSISYDIITKVHNGELKLETKEGQGTSFTISLPA